MAYSEKSVIRYAVLLLGFFAVVGFFSFYSFLAGLLANLPRSGTVDVGSVENVFSSMTNGLALSFALGLLGGSCISAFIVSSYHSQRKPPAS